VGDMLVMLVRPDPASDDGIRFAPDALVSFMS